MKYIAPLVFGLFLPFSVKADLADDAAIVFAKCDGVLERAYMDGVSEMLTVDAYRYASESFKRAALMMDDAMTLSGYYEYKKDGVEWYSSNKEETRALDFLMYICSRAAQDAMIYVDARG